MMTKTVLLLWLLVLPFGAVQSQNGFILEPGKQQVDIPFEYINNFIILNLTFNSTLSLKFIFDTGAEHTILSKRQISDLLNVRYEREFRIKGSDLTTELIAYLARQIRLEFPGKAVAPKEDILVLQEDYFRFEEYSGINVHGILAANVFSKYIIKINFQKQVITLYDRDRFKMRDEGFEPIPVEIYRNKIYLKTKVQLLPDSVADVKLLLDTGAGLPLLLFNNTHPLVHLPPNVITANIGMGLGGYLEGFTGRVFRMDLGSYIQQNIVTYFQSLDTSQNLEYLNHRNGLIGNSILNRFQLIIDYQASKIWLKQTKESQEAFVYDRSGLSFVASGESLSKFTVQNILPNSPAAEAGFQNGDELVRIGLAPSGFFSLPEIQTKLKQAPGKTIKMVIKRNGTRLRKTFVLRDLI